MRVVLLLIALLVLFALVGWITFSNDAGRSSVNLDTEEIRQDTGEMMNKGAELLRDAEQEVAPDYQSAPELVAPRDDPAESVAQ